ncbi:MAG: chromosome segregation protein SMC [Candidatus Poseidoniaceae archaeon]
MYLKALEVSNFKSFKGELTIPMDRGFTAITGPNGSGKSNCGDAIQFVLGPRSNKVIRAQNAKDLIFNGGKNNKPARACQVTLVFANPLLASGRRRLPLDQDEVRMTRAVRLTKSNNIVTDYLLDDQESSQKTFHRLLSSANARPDGYNIVLQGDVTRLAKMTAKERRKVLDGVAGVTSYDDEIRKAEKQRSMVEGYIERIGLLEDEQKARLKDLTKEKDLALKVTGLVEELKVARRLSAQAKYASQQAERQYQLNERVRIEEEADTLLEQVRQGDKVMVTLDDQIGTLQKQIEDLLGGDNNGLMGAINELQIRIATSQDRIDESADKDAEDAEELTHLAEAQVAVIADLKAFEDGLNAANEDLQKALTSLNEARKEEEEVRKALASSGSENAALTRQLSKATEAVEEAQSSLMKAQEEVNRVATQAEMLGEQLSQAQEASESARLALAESEHEGEQLNATAPEQDRKKLAENLHAAGRAESKLLEESQAVETRLRETERKLSAAKAEMENRAGSRGMAGGAAAVLAARDRGELSGIIGTVAELCQPRDLSHTDALATAIGGGMTSVVVDNDEVAAKAIQWLKQNRAGRATFLPLNKLNNTRPAGRATIISKKPGVIGFANELLDYDPRIDIAIRFVLRNTLVVDSLATARANMGGVRLVTLRGDVTEAGGAMVGGAKRKMTTGFGGNIQGANEVQTLTADVERFRLMAETVNGALDEARRQQATIRSQINDLSNNDHSQRHSEWKATHKQAKTNHNTAVGAVGAAEKRLSDLEAEGAHLLKLLDAAQAALATAKNTRQTAQTALEDASPAHLKDRLHATEMKRTEAEGLKAKAEASLSSDAGHRTLLQTRIDECTSRIESIEKAALLRSERMDELSSQVASDTITLQAKEAERREFLDENQGLEDERVALIEERSSLKAELQQKAQEAQSRRSMSIEIGRALEQKEITIAETLGELIEQGYQPAEEGAQLPSLGDAERKERGLQRRLDEYGPVNMLAIEQFDACQARLDGMKEDFKTLQSRRKHLLDVTDKLESQRKERLVNVLVKVNENFKVAYNSLSDGGRGELFLENPEEPFKGGLELWAQPRGKSAKVTRHQLSGGEQSMAALALIFAIQDYDPSPFYYFDEVDQNLDGYNAERIAMMCRERSKRAQFIMVTLRKVSLRLADHHIGITHGGDGCSRRIVDFDRERAIALGEKALAEAEKDNEKNHSRIEEARAAEHEMPQVPDALPTPTSLGGLLPHMESKPDSTAALSGLTERTAELTEDIEEYQEVADAVREAEQETAIESKEESEETLQ